MKDLIEAKLEEHVRVLLDKPALTGEEYAVLERYLERLEAAEAASALAAAREDAGRAMGELLRASAEMGV